MAKIGTETILRSPVPAPADETFVRETDPPLLRAELARLRHEERKRASGLDFVGAAEAAQVRMALLRGYRACQRQLELMEEQGDDD